jgi:sRNA-binding regulator protein Hfq
LAASWCVWILALLCISAPAARADQVTLKNGDRLTGTIVRSDGKSLLLKTDAAGDLTLKWDAVSAIVSSQPLNVQLNNGQTLSGNVTTDAGLRLTFGEGTF